MEVAMEAALVVGLVEVVTAVGKVVVVMVEVKEAA